MKQTILPSHERHVEILDKIRPLTRFVEIVIPYGDVQNDELIIALEPFLVETKKVQEWTGTISGGGAVTLHRYFASDDLFQCLSEYEGFFMSIPYKASPDDFIHIHSDIVLWQMEYTSFGDKDIAFFDEDGNVLFYTTTHEGDAFIDEKLGWQFTNIEKVTEGKKDYLSLLLLADESEIMVDKYLERGEMFILYDDGVNAECVVTREADGVYEIKNIAVAPEYQRRGYGKHLVEFVLSHYTDCKVMLVGTGESDSILSFYRSCGFAESHRIKNFFTDNYDHPMVEDGVQLVDMFYLKHER